MVLAFPDLAASGAYKFVLVLHILSAIVGFGATFLNGLYAREIQKRPGREGIAVYEANFTVSGVGEYFIYAVAVFGVLLVLLSDDVYEFTDTFIWLSILLYVIALSLVHAVLLPAEKRMGVLMREMADGPPPGGAEASGPPPQVAELEQLGKRAGAIGATLNLFLVVILFLMIWQPGV